MYGVIYIANAGAGNVTRDYDYSAALYRALNATPGCVMFTQWLASYSENTRINAEKKSIVYLHKKGVSRHPMWLFTGDVLVNHNSQAF